MYSFLDEKNKILYVGKAKNLQNRLKSYTQLKLLSPRIKKMVLTAKSLQFEILNSELESLLIEAELINAHQPQYNILLKDDKTPVYVFITAETYPRVLKVRKKEINLDKKGVVLGPFPSTYKLNEVLKIARRIFPWCNNPNSNQIKDQNNILLKPCFYHHLDLCPGACIGSISPEEYQEQIKKLTLFLKGKKKSVLKSIKKNMLVSAKEENFEKAGKLKKQLEIIEEVTNPQFRLKPNLVLPAFGKSKAELGLVQLQKILRDHFHLPKNYQLQKIEGYDVSNIQGTNPAVSMVVAIDGEMTPSEYRIFNIKSLNTPNDFAMLQEALQRRQNHEEWSKPNLVVVDGGGNQVKAVLKIWQWLEVPIIGIAKKPDRLVLPIKNNEKYKIVNLQLDEDHPALNLIQKIRDESHRFAQKQHKKRRLRSMFE